MKGHFSKISSVFRISLLILAAVSLWPACSDGGKGKPWVALVVGSRQISVEQLKRDISAMGYVNELVPSFSSPEGKALLERIIRDYLILEYAKDHGIQISEAELNYHTRRFLADYKNGALKEVLLRESIDLNQWRERLQRQLILEKVAREVTQRVEPPTHKELKRYFEEHHQEVTIPSMVKFRQIVCKTKEAAKEALGKLRKGEEFGKVARQYSIAPEAEEDGEVGWISKGTLDPSMDNALFSLKVGQISPVVRTPYGYHIFQVLEKRKGGKKDTFQSIEEIEKILFAQKKAEVFAAWVESLRKKYPVKINNEVLAKIEGLK